VIPSATLEQFEETYAASFEWAFASTLVVINLVNLITKSLVPLVLAERVQHQQVSRSLSIFPFLLELTNQSCSCPVFV